MAKAARGRTARKTQPAASSIETMRLLAEQRIAIEGINTEIDGGRFPAKGIAGQVFSIEADIFSDGHDVVAAAIADGDSLAPGVAREELMVFLENDRWRVEIVLPEPGRCLYTILAWRDLFAAWRRDVEKKIIARQNVELETTEGLHLVEDAIIRATETGPGSAGLDRLKEMAAALSSADGMPTQLEALLDD